jgi:hypothetical protein
MPPTRDGPVFVTVQPRERGPVFVAGDEYQGVTLVEIGSLADREGFEPSLEFPLNTLSKRAPSATRPPVLLGEQRTYAIRRLPASGLGA